MQPITGTTRSGSVCIRETLHRQNRKRFGIATGTRKEIVTSSRALSESLHTLIETEKEKIIEAYRIVIFSKAENCTEPC